VGADAIARRDAASAPLREVGGRGSGDSSHRTSKLRLLKRKKLKRLSPTRRTALRRRVRRFKRPIRFGTLRRTAPLSDEWGRDRGTPIDRYYIEQFLGRERHAIRGHVLELLDSSYTQRFGVGVEQADVLDIDAGNPNATIVADLAAADAIPSESFDCVILTQTLQFIYDLPAAVGHVHRTLKPGGTLLCTAPSISRISRRTLDTEYWRFTTAGCALLFEQAFEQEDVHVESCGNVLSAIAFLTGLASEELSRAELEETDPYFPLLITIRAQKSGPI
jgi:SAM-dependent methyltransferase